MGDVGSYPDLSRHRKVLVESLCITIDACTKLREKLQTFSPVGVKNETDADIQKVKQSIDKLNDDIADVFEKSPQASCSFQERNSDKTCDIERVQPTPLNTDGTVASPGKDINCADKETQTNNSVVSGYGQTCEIVPGYHRWKAIGFSENITTDYVCDIQVGMDEDSQTCWVSGMTMLSPHTLVIADTDNKAIKLFDLNSYEMKARHELPVSPWDVTVLPDNQVAATLFHNESIIFVKCSDRITVRRILSVTGNCCGIAYHNRKLVVTFCHPGKIQIMSVTGEVFRSLSTEAMLSRYVTYVTITKDYDHILVSDTTDSSVLKLTWDLDVADRYKTQDQDGVCSLAPSADGTFYVCSQFTNRVHRITNGMEGLGTVLKDTDGIIDPQAVYVNDREKLLFVSCGTDQLIKVFSLIGR